MKEILKLVAGNEDVLLLLNAILLVTLFVRLILLPRLIGSGNKHREKRKRRDRVQKEEPESESAQDENYQLLVETMDALKSDILSLTSAVGSVKNELDVLRPMLLNMVESTNSGANQRAFDRSDFSDMGRPETQAKKSVRKDLEDSTQVKAKIFYAKSPELGQFKDRDLEEEQNLSNDYVFAISINEGESDATFTMRDNIDSQKYALRYPHVLDMRICDYSSVPSPDSQLVVEHIGTLKLDDKGRTWNVDKKLKLSFL